MFEYLNKWFKANKLSFSFDRTYLIKCTTKSSLRIGWYICYNDKLMSKTQDTKFLGIYAERTPSWKHVRTKLHTG